MSLSKDLKRLCETALNEGAGAAVEFNFDTDTIRGYTEIFAKWWTSAELLPWKMLRSIVRNLANQFDDPVVIK